MTGRANTTMQPNPDAGGCPFEEQGFPAAYAFDALDGEDLTQFRAHLPTCRICDAALREFREMTAQFPLLIDTDTAPQPSPALRARLLEAVAADLAAERAAAPTRAPLALPVRRRLPQAYAVAAVLLLALALGQLGWILSLQRDVNQTADQRNQAQQALSEAQTERDQFMTQLRQALAERDQARTERDQAQRSLAVTRWQLAAAQAGQQITGEVVYLRDQQRAVLVINGLPELQPGQVYQIWLIKQGGAPVPETVFLTGTTGVQANFDEYQTLAITIEPGPKGSLAPTTPILVVGSLTQ
jgi:hypothetical protein